MKALILATTLALTPEPSVLLVQPTEDFKCEKVEVVEIRQHKDEEGRWHFLMLLACFKKDGFDM